jgi:hypothetical protein
MNSANVCNLICCQKVEYRYKIVFIVVCTDRNFGSGIPHIGIQLFQLRLVHEQSGKVEYDGEIKAAGNRFEN